MASQNNQKDDEKCDHGSADIKLDRNLFPIFSCLWCREEQSEKSFSTPCLTNRCLICVTCILGQVKSTLRDRSSMPIRCCSNAIHPDTIQGIVPDEMHELYATRLGEMNVKSPLYCPVKTCSKFIPTRNLRLAETKILCPACDETICLQCRQSAETDHRCSKDPTVEDEIITKFNYKRCPRCGHGQQKLFGCDHVRCACGAHWCWGCDQNIDDCVCVDEGQEECSEFGEEEDEEEEDTTTTTVAATPGPASEIEVNNDQSSPSSPTNLDDPSARDWRNAALELGEDPSEVSDPWGCVHQDIQSLLQPDVPRYWITAGTPDFWTASTSTSTTRQEWEREVECMICHDKAKITTERGREWYEGHYDPQQNEFLDAGMRRELEKLAYWCGDCGVVCCRRCMKSFHL